MSKRRKTDSPRPTVDLGYPTPAHGNIPAFSNIEEEAEFWDTHSVVDYLDHFEPMDEVSVDSAELPLTGRSRFTRTDASGANSAR